MKFLEWLADFIGAPIEHVVEWLDNLVLSIGEWWDSFYINALQGATLLIVDGISILAICYAIYCTYRIICTTKDDTFSEYINKSMIAGLAYFFAKCGGKFILNFIGVM